jgi:hypothetical protein
MFLRPTLLLLGALLLAVSACLLPGMAEAQPCHPHMQASSEAPAPPPREAEVPPEPRAEVPGFFPKITFEQGISAPGETQVSAPPFVSMEDWSCCGAGCKNALCVGGKSVAATPASEPSLVGGGPAPFAIEAGPLFGHTPSGLKKPPRSFV